MICYSPNVRAYKVCIDNYWFLEISNDLQVLKLQLQVVASKGVNELWDASTCEINLMISIYGYSRVRIPITIGTSDKGVSVTSQRGVSIV